MIDIKKLREICDAATSGPWEHRRGHNAIYAPTPWDTKVSIAAAHDENAAFIAAARTAMPELLDEVERLMRHVKYLEGSLRLASRAFNELDAELQQCVKETGWRIP